MLVVATVAFLSKLIHKNRTRFSAADSFNGVAGLSAAYDIDLGDDLKHKKAAHQQLPASHTHSNL